MSLSHIKVVREKRTIFLQCVEDDLVEVIKRKLQKFYPSPPEDMRLYRNTLLLDERGDMYSQDIRNGCVLRLCLKKSRPGDAGEWEVLEENKPQE